MFDLLRFICEQIFGTSLFLSRESFDYLSIKLENILIELIQQSFSIALRSKRTRLLNDDFQIILKSRLISPLFGYCCSSTINQRLIFKTIRQNGRILFIKNDRFIDLTNRNYSKQISRIYPILSNDNILLHIEWLVIHGEQKNYPMKFLLSNKSILNYEENIFLSSLIQSNNRFSNIITNDSIAFNTILSSLIQWYQIRICDCLQHSCQLEKRRQLTSYLIILDNLLTNSSNIIQHYLYILTPIITNCLLYQFEINEPSDFDENSSIDSGHIWYIRLLASRVCVKILQRSNSFIYDDFYIRIISRLICVLININSSLSMIYAILYLFQQLGIHVSRRFLLPYLFDIPLSKCFQSKSILKIFEHIAEMFIENIEHL